MIRKMVLFKAILLGLILITANSNASPISKNVAINSDIPPTLNFVLHEESNGIDLHDISTSPTGNGEVDISCNGIWMLFVNDGTAGGDGKMKSSTGRSLRSKIQVGIPLPLYNLPGSSEFPLTIKAGTPGVYSFTTAYHQPYDIFDYGGDYSINVKWTVSAYF